MSASCHLPFMCKRQLAAAPEEQICLEWPLLVCLQGNHFPILSIIFIFPCVLIKPIQTSATIYPHYCL
jgi:hypothetical protein